MNITLILQLNGAADSVRECLKYMCGLETGRLMARFCVAFDTMKIFHGITGRESMEELVSVAFCRQNITILGELASFS